MVSSASLSDHLDDDFDHNTTTDGGEIMETSDPESVTCPECGETTRVPGVGATMDSRGYFVAYCPECGEDRPFEIEG